MVKKRKILSLLIILAAASCSKDEAKPYDIPGDYRLWKNPAGKVLDYPVPGHGHSFRVIYANELSYHTKKSIDAKKNERLEFPDGSVIIKEVYKKIEDINRADPELDIMVKDGKSRESTDGWLYYVKKSGKKSAVPIKGKLCTGCHEAANGRHPYFDNNARGIFRDYIFVNIGNE